MSTYFLNLSLAILGMLPVILLDVRHHLDNFDVNLWAKQNWTRLLVAIGFLFCVLTVASVSPEAQTLLSMVFPVSGEMLSSPGAVMLGVTTAGLFITGWKKSSPETK